MPTPPGLDQIVAATASLRSCSRALAEHRTRRPAPAGFAYADAHLLNGEVLPLLRLRYGGSANHWGVALYRPSTGKYEDQVWFSGTPVEALDFAGGVLLIAADI